MRTPLLRLVFLCLILLGQFSLTVHASEHVLADDEDVCLFCIHSQDAQQALSTPVPILPVTNPVAYQLIARVQTLAIQTPTPALIRGPPAVP